MAEYEPKFKVEFHSKGDTTKDAFGKHIQEIARIYGLLAALDEKTIDASAVNDILNKHVNSSNPHPNWKINLANTTGSIGIDRVTGNIDGNRINSIPFSKVTGDIDGSRVTGTLSRATIDASRVSNLQNVISGLIPASSGSGITNSSIGEKGYVKFGDILTLQWGKERITSNPQTFQVSFSVGMTTCLSVLTTSWGNQNEIFVTSANGTGFVCRTQGANSGQFTYLAIGK